MYECDYVEMIRSTLHLNKDYDYAPHDDTIVSCHSIIPRSDNAILYAILINYRQTSNKSRYDMDFIEPMHGNKPNITYLF